MLALVHLGDGLHSTPSLKIYSVYLSPASCTLALLSDAPHRPPVPEPDATKEEKASHLLQQSANLRAGETLSPAEVPGVGRARHLGQGPENDRRASQDLVSEQADKMAVRFQIWCSSVSFTLRELEQKSSIIILSSMCHSVLA